MHVLEEVEVEEEELEVVVPKAGLVFPALAHVGAMI